jgi:hypothetical protein
MRTFGFVQHSGLRKEAAINGARNNSLAAAIRDLKLADYTAGQPAITARPASKSDLTWAFLTQRVDQSNELLSAMRVKFGSVIQILGGHGRLEHQADRKPDLRKVCFRPFNLRHLISV